MKQRVSRFFRRNRHLIVISLIIAVILAALTPFLIPLALEMEDRLANQLPFARFGKLNAEDFAYYTIHCLEHRSRTAEEMVLSDSCSQKVETEHLRELCKILNEAPQERNKHIDPGGALCTIYLQKDRNAFSARLLRDVKYTLHNAAGRYSLSSTGRNGKPVTWYISEQTAQAILAMRGCSQLLILDNPRSLLHEAENVAAVQVTVWERKDVVTSEELSLPQIAQFCAFMKDTALFYSSTGEVDVPFEDGWQAEIQLKNGLIWRLAYEAGQTFPVSLGKLGENGENRAVIYRISKQSGFSDLPALLGIA